jgi:hypothetical protein
MSKKILISFAAGSKWYKSQADLESNAKSAGFNGVISYTEKSKCLTFQNKYTNIFEETRGYGFWQWKPIILLDAMSMLEDGDIVSYIDSGNRIVNKLDYIFEKCEEQDIVLFDNRDGNYNRETHKNKEWTKRDCFVLMGCDEEKYYDACQVDASYQFYKKNQKTIDFLNEYKDFCSNDNIISDVDNVTKDNLPTFIDHRHDQSVLSLMAVKYNIQLLPEPSEWGNYLSRPYPQLFWHHRGVF